MHDDHALVSDAEPGWSRCHRHLVPDLLRVGLGDQASKKADAPNQYVLFGLGVLAERAPHAVPEAPAQEQGVDVALVGRAALAFAVTGM